MYPKVHFPKMPFQQWSHLRTMTPAHTEDFKLQTAHWSSLQTINCTVLYCTVLDCTALYSTVPNLWCSCGQSWIPGLLYRNAAAVVSHCQILDWERTVQYSAVQYSAVQYSTVSGKEQFCCLAVLLVQWPENNSELYYSICTVTTALYTMHCNHFTVHILL